MSTTDSAIPTASAEANNTSQPDNSPGASNSLYLFTFLTTLVLLLAVSCGIVLRSLILRRRFRRRLEEAIAAGIILPEHVEHMRRSRGGRDTTAFIGEKPKMWEILIEDDGRNDMQGKWTDILPVSASIIPAASDSSQNPSSDAPHIPQEGPQRRRRFGLFRRSSPSTSTPSIPQPPPFIPSQSQNPSPVREDQLQLTVLIALPNPHSPRSSPDQSTSSKGKETDDTASEESRDRATGELPEVVFGVAEVPWGGGNDWREGKDVKSSEDT